VDLPTEAPAAAPRRQPLLWAGLLVLVLLPFAWKHRYDWRTAYGLEPEWIAHSIADGHGFSFRGDHVWLIPHGPRTFYSPTAWQEPVNPIVLGALFRAGGRYYGRLFAVAVQTAVLLATAVLLYLLGRRVFDEWTGGLASILLLVQPHVHYLVFGTFMTASFAGLAVLLVAAAFVHCLGGATSARAFGAGATLGGAMLTSAATGAFFPVGLAVLLRVRGGTGRAAAWRRAALFVLGVIAVLTPWTVRNYRVFGGFVPTRSGIGQIVYVGNPVLAETFVPGLLACPTSPGPWWTAQSASEAVLHARAEEEWPRSLGNKGYDCIEALHFPGWAGMNEVQRDRVYLREALAFVREHPALTASMTWTKAVSYFFTGWPIYIQALTAVAGLGIYLGRKRPGALVLASMIPLYAVAYVISVPYHFRYRYPIEPLLTLFAAFAAVAVARWIAARGQRAASA
jgi:hypothetical protein